MGQYYRGAILGRTTKKSKKVIIRKSLCPFAHNNLQKLMEHSYVGNAYVKAFEKLLHGEYYAYPFVWVGDYADDYMGVSVYDMACDYIENATIRNAKKRGYRPVDYDFVKGNMKKSYSEFRERIPYEEVKNTEYDFIINFDKKQFVRIPKMSNKKDKYGYPERTIHPLPLLCASGNQQGSGDYYGTDEQYVGIWAYDRIGVDNEIPENFTEVVVNFKERY